MKEFDLEKALAGEPVKLRDGTKAYVKFVMPDDYDGEYLLRGFFKYRDEYVQGSWMINGCFSSTIGMEDSDIIGMWEEPRTRVTLTLPCPLKRPQEDMWYIENGVVHSSLFTEANQNYSEDGLENGFYFASKEDAQEWLDALRNARI